MSKAWIAAVAALVASAPLATALAEDAAPGFADMLRLIPASERTWQAWRTFSYVDFRAVEAAAGVPHAQSEIRLGDGATAVFSDWPAERRAAWQANLRRVLAGPPLLTAYGRRIGTLDAAMADVVGVDFFTIDRALVFWETPGDDGVQVLAGDPPIADLQTMRDWSLSSRGFLLSEIDGVPVWHRYGDNVIASSLTDRDSEADPLDGDLNRSVRLAVLPDLLIVGQQWSELEAVLPLRDPDTPATDLAELIETMTSAALTLDGVDDRVLQARAATVFELGMSRLPVARMIDQMQQWDGGMPQAADLDALMDDGRPQGPPLPPYPLALFLDLQAGSHQVNAIALPYADRETASLAAQALTERLSVWVPNGDAEAIPLVSRIGGTVETIVHDAPGIGRAIAETVVAQALANADGPDPDAEAAWTDQRRRPVTDSDGAVAVVAVRYPMPTGDDSADLLGHVWSVWMGSIIDGVFTPLLVF